jgi:UDP-N-acetylglucosamine:LPS N-acetylglucosamine transferase
MRALVLYCEEGEGHASAARVLSAELEAAGVETISVDALRQGLGRLIPFFSRDAYRIQVRWLRWTYGLEYFLFTRFPPARALARAGLAWLGGRPLRRLIERCEPSLVISTHPAVTNVLGHLRRRRRVTVPAVATITDFGVHALWSHPGVDLHLVMHERSRPAVERVAGPGSASVVEPIVAASFRSPPSKPESRRALGLPADGPVVVISGGGWGVGELEAAARAALAVPSFTVVCLCGRNEPLRRRLEQRLGSADRVSVLPFTEQMPELLAAADVLVDSTVGVTCLEALSAGCRVIAFGSPPGHSRDNARAMATLGLAELPRSSAELTECLAQLAQGARGRLPSVLPPGNDLVAAILGTEARLAPTGSRRPALIAALAAACMLVFTGWTFASPAPYPLVARAFDLDSLTSVKTTAPEVGLVVEAPPSQIPNVARELARLGLHASFAISRPPAPATVSVVARLGDGLLPAVSPGGATGFLRFRTTLRTLVHALALGRPFFYMRSPSGLTLSDYLIAKDMGGRLVAPSDKVTLREGTLVLVPVRGYADRPLATVAAGLSSRGLRGVSLAELVASAARTRATVFERASASAPPPTSSSESTRPHARHGEAGHHSRATSGASATGTNVVTANTIGATCATGRRCSADISLSVPSPDATFIATNQTASPGQR